MTRWGILGAGGIARVFANGLLFSKTGRLTAIASVTESRRSALAGDFSIPRSYSRYEDLLADPEVDAVYISLIHPEHARWTIAAARAGKHILVEKPMAMDSREAEQMIQAARQNDVFLMEAFMYRCHPQMARLAEIIRSGAIGDVLAIRSPFSFSTPFDASSRLFSKALGGGGILDVGCYPASLSRFVAGAASGKAFAEPERLKAVGTIGPSGVDTFTAAVLQFPGGIFAEITCGLSCAMPTEAQIFGTRGRIVLPNPWLPSSPVRFALKPLPREATFPAERILVWADGRGSPEEVIVTADRDLYAYEADAVDQDISRRQSPAMTWDDSLGNMRVLDRWLAEISPA